jgi:hypothetical protein
MRDCLESHDGSITTSFDRLDQVAYRWAGQYFKGLHKVISSLSLTPKETILSNLCLPRRHVV